MEIPKWEEQVGAKAERNGGFNPSFDGNPKVGVVSWGFSIFVENVSILLLMEIPKWVALLKNVEQLQ